MTGLKWPYKGFKGGQEHIMVKSRQDSSPDAATQMPQSLGDYAHQIIEDQYQRIIKQEKKVLADKDPEALHQMRVGTRRLRTALQVFAPAIKMPKAGSAKQLRDLASVLGAVRDLDVQLASLEDDYRPNLGKQEQKHLDRVSVALTDQRKDAFAQMKAVLTQPLYQTMKSTYVKWLKQPQYTAVAQLPLAVLLPDLLSPLLAHLLLHPGWLIPTEQASGKNGVMLHELRKACKHVRYQAEFFVPFYHEDFKNWIEEIKDLQAQLGEFQDTEVFLELSAHTLGRKTQLPSLQDLVDQKRSQALSNWEAVRQKYLDQAFRYRLHQMLLQPAILSQPIHPELIGADSANLN
jgi:CHAD domain-containing protein